MKHFGDLAFIRGIIYYKLSPHEQKPFAGAFTKGLPNFLPRMSSTIMTWLPPFAIALVVYKTVEDNYRFRQRKDPRDFIDEVDPNSLA